jgi:hypothetical protein
VSVTGAEQVKDIAGTSPGSVAGKGTGAAKSTTRFEGETVYVATVTLKPAAGFQFSTGGVTVTHSGSSVILDVLQTDKQVVEKKVYFSGETEVEKDSAIDIMKLAADFSSLSLKLLPWQEPVDLGDQTTDIGKVGA